MLDKLVGEENRIQCHGQKERKEVRVRVLVYKLTSLHRQLSADIFTGMIYVNLIAL